MVVISTACSPSITIIHQDPTHESIRIIVDNKDRDRLRFGKDLSITVSKGNHTVVAFPEGETQCPWTTDGEGWTIWADKDAILTLLPPPRKRTNGGAATESGNNPTLRNVKKN